MRGYSALHFRATRDGWLMIFPYSNAGLPPESRIPPRKSGIPTSHKNVPQRFSHSSKCLYHHPEVHEVRLPLPMLSRYRIFEIHQVPPYLSIGNLPPSGKVLKRAFSLKLPPRQGYRDGTSRDERLQPHHHPQIPHLPSASRLLMDARQYSRCESRELKAWLRFSSVDLRV